MIWGYAVADDLLRDHVRNCLATAPTRVEDLLDGLPSDPIVTPGMPASLGAMIAEWVLCPATPLDEIVMITGWSVGRVQSFL